MGELGNVGSILLALIVLAIAGNIFTSDVSILLSLCLLLYTFFATQKFSIGWSINYIRSKDKPVSDRIRFAAIVIASMAVSIAYICGVLNTYLIVPYIANIMLASRYLAIVSILASIWHFNR